MNRQQFDTLEHEALILACMEPTVQQIRAKDMTVKAQVYAQLTEGQKMMMMFRVVHGHVGHSMEELFAWVDYLRLEEPQTWSAFKDAMQRLEDAEMLGLAAEIKEREESAQEQLHARYHELAARTNQRIADYIRNHPEQFVVFED